MLLAESLLELLRLQEERNVAIVKTAKQQRDNFLKPELRRVRLRDSLFMVGIRKVILEHGNEKISGLITCEARRVVYHILPVHAIVEYFIDLLTRDAEGTDFGRQTDSLA